MLLSVETFLFSFSKWYIGKLSTKVLEKDLKNGKEMSDGDNFK